MRRCPASAFLLADCLSQLFLWNTVAKSVWAHLARVCATTSVDTEQEARKRVLSRDSPPLPSSFRARTRCRGSQACVAVRRNARPCCARYFSLLVSSFAPHSATVWRDCLTVFSRCKRGTPDARFECNLAFAVARLLAADGRSRLRSDREDMERDRRSTVWAMGRRWRSTSSAVRASRKEGARASAAASQRPSAQTQTQHVAQRRAGRDSRSRSDIEAHLPVAARGGSHRRSPLTRGTALQGNGGRRHGIWRGTQRIEVGTDASLFWCKGMKMRVAAILVLAFATFGARRSEGTQRESVAAYTALCEAIRTLDTVLGIKDS
ncbi:hypothetical protein ERJ75_000896700 [Trypanosoma vivax]|nr:hypothetical protein ERJ75_000896700 [Trypanosoma vivax]